MTETTAYTVLLLDPPHEWAASRPCWDDTHFRIVKARDPSSAVRAARQEVARESGNDAESFAVLAVVEGAQEDLTPDEALVASRALAQSPLPPPPALRPN